MKQLPEEQRPYEKCFTQGADALSDSELLAVILRSGTHGKNSIVIAEGASFVPSSNKSFTFAAITSSKEYT